MKQPSPQHQDNDIDRIPLVAGYDDNNEPVLEQIEVRHSTTPGECILEKSPAFVRNLAAGDRIRYPADTGTGYELIQRSGNLSIRVLRKHNIDDVAAVLTPEIELREGTLDRSSPGLLVYTLHVSTGFQAIESLLDGIVGQWPDTIWYYGNVYDPQDGATPLNWWNELAREV